MEKKLKMEKLESGSILASPGRAWALQKPASSPGDYGKLPGSRAQRASQNFQPGWGEKGSRNSINQS